MAVLSDTVAEVPSALRQDGNVLPEEHALLLPHLQFDEVHIFDRGAPHAPLVPHRQNPNASQVSVVPLHVTPSHGPE